jgi:hypothetical protein
MWPMPSSGALCQAQYQRGLPPQVLYCTRQCGHEDEHVATIGPWADGGQELARWKGNGMATLTVGPVEGATVSLTTGRALHGAYSALTTQEQERVHALLANALNTATLILHDAAERERDYHHTQDRR